ncbi:MAG: heme o synthase, partial [Alphaproteobacteria bacterium]
MSDTSLDITQSQFDVSSVAGTGSVGDFFVLMKPRVMSLVVFTALVG